MLVCLQVCSDGRLSVHHLVIVSGTQKVSFHQLTNDVAFACKGKQMVPYGAKILSDKVYKRGERAAFTSFALLHFSESVC